jgi:hypothetical protein
MTCDHGNIAMCIPGGRCSPRPTRALTGVARHPDSALRAGFARGHECPTMALIKGHAR